MRRNDNSRRNQIYNSILESILNLEFQPEQIISEPYLISKLNCSKTLVREALVSLCDDGVLKSIPRCGYEVIRLTCEDVEDMIQLRYILEGGFLLSCIDTITEAQIEQLRNIDASYSAEDDIWKNWETNSNFHLQLLALSRNSCAYYELKRVLSRLKRAYAQFYWGKWGATECRGSDEELHQQIINSLAKRDPISMLEALRMDLNSFGNITCHIQDAFAYLRK